MWLLQREKRRERPSKSQSYKTNQRRMKTPFDPRHKRRQQRVEELFKFDFHTQQVSDATKTILSHKEDIDTAIHTAAPDFPIEKINKIDLAILRLAVYELLIEKKEPPKVIIDEAVELAKEFGGDTSPAFVNGALGKLLHEESTNLS